MRFGGIVPVVATKQPWGLGMRACPTFIAAISLWVVGIPAAVAAEQPQRVPQVGFLEAMVRADYDPAKDPI
jgi:chorismate synthase